MKTIFTILVTILLSFNSFFAQEAKEVSKSKSINDLKLQIKSFKNKKDFNVNYDRFDDKTLVSFDGFELMSFGESVAGILRQGRKNEEPPSLMMKLYFNFESATLTKNVEKFFLIFTSSDTEWRFLKNRELFAIADGERFKFGEGNFDSNIKVGKGIAGGIAIREALVFVVSQEELSKLADAKSLEIRIGKREEQLKDKHKQMFKNMIALATISE